MEGLPLTRAASVFAELKHAGQRRRDGTPFVLHPFEVASLLYKVGAPDHVIAAGVTHDLLEKADVTETELRERFGRSVCALVLAVTEDDRIPGYAERKAALRRQVAGAGEDALTLFAADKLSKLRELRRESAGESRTPDRARDAQKVRARRLRHYRRSLALLEERLPESPLVREMRAELAALLGGRAPSVRSQASRLQPST